MKQMQKPEMVSHINRVIGTNSHHSELQVVLYGLGSLEPNKKLVSGEFYAERHYIQLGFAILLREKFKWVNDIVVYDPVHSPLDEMVLNSLDCTCLSINENCKRTVDRPTLFFMPHMPYYLTENVLKANSTPAQLNKIIILGNSYSKLMPDYFRDQLQTIFNGTHTQHEFPLRASDKLTDIEKVLDPDPVISSAFVKLSWQFFVARLSDGSSSSSV